MSAAARPSATARPGATTRPSAARLAVVLVLTLVAVLAAATPAGATAARALVDADLGGETETEQAMHVDKIATQLGARYLRLSVEWNRAEPQQGVYDEPYLAGIDRAVRLAAERGVRVVVTVCLTPEWASDRKLWDEPPYEDVAAGVYAPFYAPRADAADDFGAFAAMLATRFQGRVFAYECWNEPNIWTFLYPQTLAGDDKFAAERYTRLLKAFTPAVRAADPEALVIGGATAPVGTDDPDNPYRTSPQRFARQLKEEGAFARRDGKFLYMDAYSHHPYQPGPAPLAPEAPPRQKSTTVTLQNLGTLLDIVPDLPFYLTEYGYNTAPSDMFGVWPGEELSQSEQADYLRRAYRYAGRYGRVKALFWYLRRDASPSDKAGDPAGVYTGLRTVSNSRKRSWFVFAGGMRLTLAARTPIRAGAYTKLTGALTCSRLATAADAGGLADKPLQVQRRLDGVWRTVKAVTTCTDGRYTTWVRLSHTRRLRVRWVGVVTSPTRSVTVR